MALMFIVLLSAVTTLFVYFFVNTQVWNAKFQEVNEKKRSHLNWYQNLKKVTVSRVVKKVMWSSTFKGMGMIMIQYKLGY